MELFLLAIKKARLEYSLYMSPLRKVFRKLSYLLEYFPIVCAALTKLTPPFPTR